MSAPILLVDGRNLLYRAIFANLKNNYSSHPKYHDFVVMARFMRDWLNNLKPSAFYVFWDAPKSTLWRRKIYPEYKIRHENAYFDQIKDTLVLSQEASRAILSYMGVKQFFKKEMEADDLIYSACRVLSPQQLIIISSDHDYEQLVFRHSNISLYNPMADGSRGDFIPKPEFDPVIAKALAGDSSDNVAGYQGIGKVRSKRLASSLVDRVAFLKEKGAGVFLRNMMLIDLSLNPHVLKNDFYVCSVLSLPVVFDGDRIHAEAQKFRVAGLVTEWANLIGPFKALVS